MHPVVIVLFAILGILGWVSSIHLVNEEVFKLRWLVRDPSQSTYSVDLNIPNWRIFRTLAQRRFWVIVALILAPVLVVVWGLVLIGALVFVLVPDLIWETITDIWWTIRQRSSHS